MSTDNLENVEKINADDKNTTAKDSQSEKANEKKTHGNQGAINLEQVKRECEEMVKKEAKLSAAAAVVPVPLVDLVVDAGLLSKLLPEISAKFGLIDEQASTSTQKSDFDTMKDRAVNIAGLVLTRSIVKKTFQGFGGRIIAKQVTKFIPFGGQLVAGTIGYLMFKKIADDHIQKCYEQAKARQSKPLKTVNA